MNLGNLDPELEQFVNSYKKFGYSTKTQLANDAIRNLKREKAAETRRKWREQAAKQFSAEDVSPAWKSIDGEDFE